MYKYSIYGLLIQSTLPLTGLIPATDSADGKADVIIRDGRLSNPSEEDFENGRCFRARVGEARLSWRGIINVRVHDGKEIIFDPVCDLDDKWLCLYLLGPALGVLLHQRGLLVLHASAVGVNGDAVCFVGWKGQGKSTTAAGLCQRNYDLLSDDIVAIHTEPSGEHVVLPGMPRLKLNPDAVDILGIEPNDLDIIHPNSDKRSFQAPADSVGAPRPLRAIYMLDEGDRAEIETLPPLEKFSAIVLNVYAARFIGKTGILAPHFRQCIVLARNVPVYRFSRKFSVSGIPDALDLLEEHMRIHDSNPIPD